MKPSTEIVILNLFIIYRDIESLFVTVGVQTCPNTTFLISRVRKLQRF